WARDRRRSARQRFADVARAARRGELLAEVSGHLLVTTRPRLRERDDPVGSGLGDEPCAIEQLLDASSRVARRGSDLDVHQPALVEVATDEAGLLEHPDEDAHVTVGDERGEVTWI